ncbi:MULTISPECIES: bacterioferritin-associated ferredoxin [Dickeya]|uniref:Bacterioferritin-associated ferredoxin n=1 Tax=Dickeya aquatica TaxID=1401087 RepID=A0A375AFF1_9GAMM|nr:MULTISPECIES: bacterioferritin-associated ferredoxin [Dickeya]SLM64822.1 Bacterioferritin-associated ferredoxin [Dickeya aquatica]
MYICLCNAISDKVIRQVVRQHRTVSLKQLKQFIPVGTECGKCLRQARLIIDDEMTKNAQLNQVA